MEGGSWGRWNTRMMFAEARWSKYVLRSWGSSLWYLFILFKFIFILRFSFVAIPSIGPYLRKFVKKEVHSCDQHTKTPCNQSSNLKWKDITSNLHVCVKLIGQKVTVNSVYTSTTFICWKNSFVPRINTFHISVPSNHSLAYCRTKSHIKTQQIACRFPTVKKNFVSL